MRHRFSVVCLVLFAALAGTAHAAVSRSSVAPAGTWEGRDGWGLVVLQTDARGNVTSIVGESKGEPCSGVSVSKPLRIVRGRLTAQTKRGSWRQTIRVRLSNNRSRLTLATRVRITGGAQRCERLRSLTLTRVVAPITPAPGTWSGTDVLSGQVHLMVRKPDRPGATSPVSYLRSRTVKGPFWCGIGGRTDVPAPDGGWTTMGFAAPIPVLIPISPSTGTVRSIVSQTSPPQDGPPTTRTYAFDGTFSGPTATGTWRLTQTDAAGTIICDSGPVQWTAALAAGT